MLHRLSQQISELRVAAAGRFPVMVSGLPNHSPGTGRRILAVHRQAWAIAGLKEGDHWTELLHIADPL